MAASGSTGRPGTRSGTTGAELASISNPARSAATRVTLLCKLYALSSPSQHLAGVNAPPSFRCGVDIEAAPSRPRAGHGDKIASSATSAGFSLPLAAFPNLYRMEASVLRRLVARGGLPPAVLGAVARELVAVAREAGGEDVTAYKLLADASALHLLTDSAFLSAFEIPASTAPAPAPAPTPAPRSPARMPQHRPTPRVSSTTDVELAASRTMDTRWAATGLRDDGTAAMYDGRGATSSMLKSELASSSMRMRPRPLATSPPMAESTARSTSAHGGAASLQRSAASRVASRQAGPPAALEATPSVTISRTDMPASPVLQAAVATSQAAGETLGRLDAAMRHAMSLATSLAARRSPVKYASGAGTDGGTHLSDTRSMGTAVSLADLHHDSWRGVDDEEDQDAAHDPEAADRRHSALMHGSPRVSGDGEAIGGMQAHLAAARTGASAVEAALTKLRRATRAAAAAAAASASPLPAGTQFARRGAKAPAESTHDTTAEATRAASHEITSHATWDLAHRLAHTQESVGEATAHTADDAVTRFLSALARV